MLGISVCLPQPCSSADRRFARQNHVYITTDESFHFHNSELDEILFKLDSTENPRTFENNVYIKQWNISRNSSIHKSKYKINYYPECMMSIHVACLWMCVLFYISFVCLHVCAYASKFKVHCGSAFEPGTSRLPHYCTPPVCVPDVIKGPASCVAA